MINKKIVLIIEQTRFINLVSTAPVYSICRKRLALDYEREFGQSNEPDC